MWVIPNFSRVLKMYNLEQKPFAKFKILELIKQDFGAHTYHDWKSYLRTVKQIIYKLFKIIFFFTNGTKS